MSEENVELVRRFIDAWSAHDRAPSSSTPTRSFTPRSRTVGETFHGRDQILGVFDRWEEEWSEIRWEVDELIDVDESRVVTFHKVIATGRASGIETVRELGGLIEIRDGRVISQWIYLDRNEALQAAGLTG